jgi:hypothetical protein
LPGPQDQVSLVITAARRHADLTEGRQGILTGWHDRTRAWRAEGDGPAGAEMGVMRHRKLGYAVSMHGFRVQRAGPNIGAWLQSAFELQPRRIDDVVRDYRALLARMRAAQGLPRHILIVNAMSSTGEDDIQNYQAFDEPMGDVLLGVRARDMNLMLHDLARENDDVSIVDLDAIAADLGGQSNLPDGIHSSGALQAELRSEVLRILAARGVPGFGPASVS